jgi:uncharacterized membrane protein
MQNFHYVTYIQRVARKFLFSRLYLQLTTVSGSSAFQSRLKMWTQRIHIATHDVDTKDPHHTDKILLFLAIKLYWSLAKSNYQWCCTVCRKNR